MSSIYHNSPSDASTNFIESTPSSGGAPSPLGIYARNASPALPGGDSSSLPGSDGSFLINRFALQSAARSLLPRERVSICLRWRIPNTSVVDVYTSPSSQSSMFGSLITCSSVWLCPVCSSKISERRRVELSQGLSTWLSSSSPRRVLLVTYTMQHKSHENLQDVLLRLKKARRRLQNGKTWQNFRKKYSIAGQVRSMEITYGTNGWHVHLHILFFLSSEIAILAFEHDIKTNWIAACVFAGGYASYAYGVDVRFSDADISAYIAKFGKEPKWTAAHEVAKAVTKRGRDGSRSPLELLRDYLLGDAASGRLWLQYAVNLKGERQLFFSHGLKQLLGLVDKTDEEIAKEKERDAYLFAQLNTDQWRVILAQDARAEVLQLAASGDTLSFWAGLYALGVPYYPVYEMEVSR